MHQFPDCFPADFQKRLEQEGAQREVAYHGFRVAKYGDDHRRNFMSTYEERLRRIEETGMDPVPEKKSKRCTEYSTSLFDSFEWTDYIRKMVMRNPPGAYCLEGETDPSCGPSKIGEKKKEQQYEYRHIDWWIYKGAEPWLYFHRADKKDQAEERNCNGEEGLHTV